MASWIFVLLIVGLAGVLQAATVQLHWLPPSRDVKGGPLGQPPTHRVYWALEGQPYGLPLEVGTNATATVLLPGPGHYRVSVSAAVRGLEGPRSPELPIFIPEMPEDTVAPDIAITRPIDGDRVDRRSTVKIRLAASDDVGVYEVQVSIFRGGNIIYQCTMTIQPYTCDWPVPPANNKQYAIQAQASDAAGNTGFSNTVIVTSR